MTKAKLKYIDPRNNEHGYVDLETIHGDEYKHWTVDVCLSHGDYYYDADDANRCIRFMESCVKHSKGKWRGKPLILEKWQMNIVQCIIGIKSNDTGLRRFTRVSAWLPRKQAKSTFFAALGIYLFGWDNERGAEVIIGASTRDQANLIFSFCKYNSDLDTPIGRRTISLNKSITDKKEGGVLKVVSSDAGTVHGLNVSCGIVDELHVHKTRDLYDAIKTASGSREQPLFITISTAGVVNTFAHLEFKHAERVLMGETTQMNLFPLIYGAKEWQDPFDVNTWRCAMPNLGVSVFKRFVKEEAEEAKNKPSALNAFLQLQLNIWVSSTEAWIQEFDWRKNKKDIPALLNIEGKPRAWLGFDLSKRKDLTTVSVVVEDGHKLNLYTVGFIPSEQIEDKQKNEIPDLGSWINDGAIQICAGAIIDKGDVRNFIVKLDDILDIQLIAYDPYDSEEFVLSLQDHDFKTKKLPPTMSYMSTPTKEFEASVLAEHIQHEGHGLMSWFIGNTVLERNSIGQVRPSKRKSRNKIDGTISSVIAYAAWLAEQYNEDDDVEQNYNDNNDLFII